MNDVPRIIKARKWLVEPAGTDNEGYCVKPGFRSFFILTGNPDIEGYPFDTESFGL